MEAVSATGSKNGSRRYRRGRRLRGSGLGSKIGGPRSENGTERGRDSHLRSNVFAGFRGFSAGGEGLAGAAQGFGVTSKGIAAAQLNNPGRYCVSAQTPAP